MKSLKMLTMALTLLLNMTVFAQVITGSPAKSIYKVALKKEIAINSGDGVLSKSGEIYCLELGKVNALKYVCGTISQADAKVIYTKLLKKIQPMNSGDNVLEKSADVNCLEIGLKAPFTYRCEVI